YPGSEYAQREHLMIVATLPYLLLAQARIERHETARSLVLSTALFAAVGFALKPHFLMIPLLVEALVVVNIGWRAALRDLVPWTLTATLLAYATFVVLVTPDYLTLVVPLAMDSYLGLGDQGAWGVLFDSELTASAVLLVPLAIVSLFLRRPLARLVAVTAI